METIKLDKNLQINEFTRIDSNIDIEQDILKLLEPVIELPVNKHIRIFHLKYTSIDFTFYNKIEEIKPALLKIIESLNYKIIRLSKDEKSYSNILSFKIESKNDANALDEYKDIIEFLVKQPRLYFYLDFLSTATILLEPYPLLGERFTIELSKFKEDFNDYKIFLEFINTNFYEFIRDFKSASNIKSNIKSISTFLKKYEKQIYKMNEFLKLLNL